MSDDFMVRQAYHQMTNIQIGNVTIKKFDLILTNSINTANRLKHFTWKDSQVLYPPVKLNEFKWKSNGDYYISVSRLSSAKRIDHIVEAFLELPDKKLIVIYGENDPQKEEIFNLASGAKNIQFVTCPQNVGFTDYIANSIAWICIPIDEDFWMVPLESMAAWKPVIWVKEWWLKETIIDGKTWFLIPEWAPVPDLIEAIKFMTPEKCLSMREACEKRARDFSYKEFERNLKEFVN